MIDKNSPHVLVIDDEADIRHLLTMSLVQMGINVNSAKNVEEAKQLLVQNVYDFCLTDLKLPDGNGLELVQLANKEYPKMPIAVITAFGNTDTAVEAMKLGAFDFLAKPVELVQLRQLLKHAFKFTAQKQSKEIYQSPIEYLHSSGPLMVQFNEQIKKIEGSNAPIIIHGAKGTEKERLAKHIHNLSSRADYNEHYLDCSTLEQEQSEELLFQTEIIERNILKQSNNSTLILSNIHCLSNHSQKRLLQVLENKSLALETEDSEVAIDVRLIVCTEDPLEEYVSESSLRDDLYFRLNVIYLKIPSIVELKNEFPSLLDNYLQLFGNNKQLSNDAQQQLLAHEFPFNYRELENIIRKSAAKSDAEVIELEHLNIASQKQLQPNAQQQLISGRGELTLDQYIEQIECHEIRKALDDTRWNRTEAAKLLGVSFRTIRYKIKKLGIE